MKIRVYTPDGRERWLPAGAPVPAGWHGPDGQPLAAEHTVVIVEDPGCPGEESRGRPWLELRPVGVTAKPDAAEDKLRELLGGRPWRWAGSGPAPSAEAILRDVEAEPRFASAIAAVLAAAAADATVSFAGAWSPVRVSAEAPDGRRWEWHSGHRRLIASTPADRDKWAAAAEAQRARAEAEARRIQASREERARQIRAGEALSKAPGVGKRGNTLVVDGPDGEDIVLARVVADTEGPLDEESAYLGRDAEAVPVYRWRATDEGELWLAQSGGES